MRFLSTKRRARSASTRRRLSARARARARSTSLARQDQRLAAIEIVAIYLLTHCNTRTRLVLALSRALSSARPSSRPHSATPTKCPSRPSPPVERRRFAPRRSFGRRSIAPSRPRPPETRWRRLSALKSTFDCKLEANSSAAPRARTAASRTHASPRSTRRYLERYQC